MGNRRKPQPPENRRATGGEQRGQFAPGNTAGAATRFRPGESGNPGGRPRGVAAHIRAEVGEDGQVLIAQLLEIANRRGSASSRVQAIRELLDRGFGKAQVTGVTEGTLSVDVAGARERIARALAQRVVNLAYATPAEIVQLQEMKDQVEELYCRIRAREAAGVKNAIPLTDGQGNGSRDAE